MQAVLQKFCDVHDMHVTHFDIYNQRMVIYLMIKQHCGGNVLNGSYRCFCLLMCQTQFQYMRMLVLDLYLRVC